MLLLGAIANRASAGVPVLISTCEQTIVKGRVGWLTNDLDCAGHPYGVYLDNASLRMDGHSIAGATTGIVCKGACKVLGPGSVSQCNVGIGAFADTARTRSVRIKHVDASDNITGINVSVPFSNNPSNYLKILLTDVTANDNSNNGIACAAARIRGTDVTTNGNGSIGLTTNAPVVLRNFTSLGNSLGYYVPADLPSLLKDSTITGSTGGLDIVTGAPPILVNTICEHSADSVFPNSPWGVCSGD